MIRVPAPFLQKGVKRGSFLTCPVEKEGTQVFLRKTLYLFKNTIFVRKTKSLYLFKKCFTKKNLFETKNANLTKNAKHFLFQKGFFCKAFFEKTQTLHFLFVSWPSLQIPFLLGKPSKIFYKVKVVRT